MLWLILGQQVSITAAAAMAARLEETLGVVTPKGVLGLDTETMRRCGFSRQKESYARDLAAALIDGSFDFEAVGELADDEAVELLTTRRGIGAWTAENYLLWALGRRDVFPAGDLALQIGWQWLSDSEQRPGPDELRTVAKAWRPRRTAASLLIWYSYLGTIAARKIVT
jgi:DNA-3-methyladenine glycosylase II